MNGIVPTTTNGIEQNGKSKKVNRANSTPTGRKGKDTEEELQDNEASLAIINELTSK